MENVLRPQPIDIWRCAIIKCPVDQLDQTALDRAELIWLPDMPSFAFRADPFALWRDDCLFVFAEAMDYRTRVGQIDVLVFDSGLRLLSTKTVLRAPWHLSYPFVFEAEGGIWMLPEAYRSGTLTLYRARNFPDEWEATCNIPLDSPAIDASPVYYEGRWWLLYTPSANKAGRRSHLHIAWADRITGPWNLHPLNPVRVDYASARPGGRPHVKNGIIELPVQDCRFTYGGKIRRLSIARLDDTQFEAQDAAWLQASLQMAPFVDGLHTVSGAGPFTLLDVKRVERSWAGSGMRLRGVVSRQLRHLIRV